MSNVTPIDTDLAAAFRGGRREQLDIPGTERPEAPEVERCAAELFEVDQRIQQLTTLKKERAEALQYALHNAGIKTYKYMDPDGKRWTAWAKQKTTVGVKSGHGED